MARYFFTYHQCDGTITGDGVARVAANLDAARDMARDQALQIMSTEVRQGRLCISCWIVINDDSGHYLATVQFGDVIEIKGDEECTMPPAEQRQRAPSNKVGNGTNGGSPGA